MTSEVWNKQVQGDDCVFCLPRIDENEHWSKVASLKASTLYLHKIQTYLGYCLLVFDSRHAVRISQLSEAEWQALANDLHVSQIAIEKAVKPDHVNIAALGNQMAHLHWHIIPRYVGDVRWGGPIWTTTEEEMEVNSLSLHEFGNLLEKIRAEL